MSPRRSFLRIVSTAGVAGLLSACGFTGQPGTATPGIPTAGPLSPTASAIPSAPTATLVPATAIPATAIPATAVPATAIPATAIPATAVPPTAVPPTAAPPQALLGPEWIVLGSGDLYAIGVETVVAYRPSGLRPGSIPAQYADFRLLADQVVAVQRNSQGQPWVRMLVQPGKAFLNGGTVPFNPWGDASGRIAGYLLALEQPSAPVRVQPIDSTGNLVGQGLVFAWDRAGGQYQVSTLVEPPTPQPVQATLTSRPGAGGPLTSVTVTGTGYAPGMVVAIRLGLPNPIGEVLATGSASADGRFSTTLVMPEQLPSGDPIPEGVLNLVAMDGQNRTLASTPFTYSRAPRPGARMTIDQQSAALGSVVLLNGEGFAPNTQIFLRYGTPQPVGDALAGMTTDAQGRWSIRIQVPLVTPPAEQSTLVAVDTNSFVMASVPFKVVLG